MALMTYKTEAFTADLPTFTVADGVLIESGRSAFRVDQPYQIAVLSDFCNECGNCVTACPTSGKPYEDKPRLYLDQAEFDAESSNAFMVRESVDGVAVTARFDGETHRLSINGSMEYSSPAVAASFDGAFNLLSATPGSSASDGDVISVDAAATMYALWTGLNSSMPEIPVAGEGGTRLTAPASSS
jgi:putative selenate reductase